MYLFCIYVECQWLFINQNENHISPQIVQFHGYEIESNTIEVQIKWNLGMLHCWLTVIKIQIKNRELINWNCCYNCLEAFLFENSIGFFLLVFVFNWILCEIAKQPFVEMFFLRICNLDELNSIHILVLTNNNNYHWLKVKDLIYSADTNKLNIVSTEWMASTLLDSLLLIHSLDNFLINEISFKPNSQNLMKLHHLLSKMTWY